MVIKLEPGDRIVTMVRVEQHFLIVTERGRFYEVWWEGAPGCYKVHSL